MEDKLGILFVCTANICRSPTAEAMFRSKATHAGIAERLIIDSAGTHGYRVGDPPDAHAQTAALKRGYDLSALRARKVLLDDIERFDFILAMDMMNLTVLHNLCDTDLWRKPKLIMSYSQSYDATEVPDPYRRGDEEFERALDMLESATEGLLAEVQQQLERKEACP